MQNKLEQFHENVRQYAVEYDGVLYAVYLFVDKAGKGERVDEAEINEAISQGVKHVPLKDRYHVINQIIKTQNQL
jgi:hypothetical protein